ncbi:beta-lactamase/transpeptidase-like protein [Collybia nuda]|uniref:Beta-lactamase/transpeptidase-like protein n=1 Tax=Collybia nuda TaxID=64659 RepID=A0A9P5Y579_9AGAR|nr:beta-lactamase/transpeptidase-like protein [Collybia nuda]
MRFRGVSHALSLFGLAFLLSTSVCTQEFPSAVLTLDTDAFVNKILADWNSPGGAAVAVVRKTPQGDWNVETKGYGTATLNGSKITENTRFSIGSNSKLFDILSVGILINNETLSPRLSWTSKIASVIPGWGLMDPVASKQATIIDLMSHRTGMPRHDISFRWSDDLPSIVIPPPPPSLKPSHKPHQVKKLKSLRPSAEFRDGWQYDNMMYMVLAHIPEVLMKMPFARFVKQHIFDPLGMTSTTYSADGANASGELADGFTRQNGTVRVYPYQLTLRGPDGTGGEDGSVLSGPGGVITSAADMATWLQTLLLKGVKPGTNTSVIPAEAIGQVATGITIMSGTAPFPELSPVVYGGGQSRNTYQGHELIEHGGDITGFHSQITRLPFDNLGVAVLTNDNDSGFLFMEIIKYYLIEVALGLEHVDWNSRYKTLISAPAPPPPQLPANASLPQVKLETLTGKYNNDGYGSFELCMMFPSNPNASKACKDLTTRAPTIFPGLFNSNVPTFISDWSTASVRYVSFTHVDENVFELHGVSSYPTGDPAQPYWVESISGSPGGSFAEIVVEGTRALGFGTTGLWGAGNGVSDPQGKTVRERAEAWFDKV